MTRFARIDTATIEIVEFKYLEERPEDIPHKNVAWLPAPEVDAPDYDHDREVREGPFHGIVSDEKGFIEVRQSWKVRDKTQAEIDTDIAAKIARVDEVTSKAIANLDARLTALEGRQARSSGIAGFFRSLFGG